MFDLLDHLGIYLLIAGSYTPIVWNILRGPWRRGILGAVWLWAALGAALHLTYAPLPHWLSTAVYLAMGWCAIFCYLEVARRLSHRTLFPIVAGGVLYSLGAVLNLLGQPILWPGVFQAHELFHVFVVAASLVHYQFMFSVIAPYVHGPEMTSVTANRRQPSPFFSAPGAPSQTGG
jgi:hemolysin III